MPGQSSFGEPAGSSPRRRPAGSPVMRPGSQVGTTKRTGGGDFSVIVPWAAVDEQGRQTSTTASGLVGAARVID